MSHKITVYPNFGQRLSIYNIDDINGVHSIHIMKSSKTDSLILYKTDKDIIETVDYEFVPGKDAFSVGNEVAVSENIGQYPKYTIGKIVSMNDDTIDLFSDIDGIHSYKITDYKQISVKERTTDGKISITINENDKGNIILSYLFNDIGWRAQYNIILSDDKIKIMKLVGIIHNKTNESISGNINLVAGDFPNTLFSSDSMRSDENLERSVEGNVFDEYYRYRLGSLCLEDKTSITLSTMTDLSTEKFYQHNVSSGNKVNVGYRFNAPNYLPTGPVCLYKTHKKDIRYMGSGYIDEKQKDDVVDIILGTTTNVKINSIVTLTNLDDNRKSVNIVSSISGGNTQDIVLRYYVGKSNVISVDVEPIRKIDYLEWNIRGDTTVNINMILSR
uniref:Uncharacterized protein n=1 Tax=Pithovirus LCPAC302 TaxID=2506593 RepID=A0A481Z6C8_9VIRU|nr:MAG: hypothetical protein LCPAC302_00530 [Pithovirus LCPAC302]